ncbi:MAG: sensor histidine kinase N-terminal domain-containing protein [Gammaproteobacteria bacterium]|nr:sensor histidine kinase N-terminal domain-containing protein [Gammaproteobacteria bacterium]
MSIRSQLLFRLIIVSTILVGGTSWLAYQNVRNETRELFDAQLARSARLILSLAQAQNGDSGFSRIQQYLDENGLAVMYINFEEKTESQQTENGHIYETKLAFQIWDNEGNLVVKSYNAPLEPMAINNSGFNHTIIENFNWRTFSLLSSNKQYHCITAERIDVRNDLIIKISNDLFYMFIILVPALIIIVYLFIDKGLKPLQQLASQINRRSGDNLELIANDYKDTEIVTIKNALNQLLHRLKETLAREKRITSDAAHELRTPLAAIRLHTELAKNAKNQQEKSESLDHIIHGVDRTTHLVEQLLTLARLEPELLANDFTEVDLSTLIIEECALLSPLAIDKKIDISFDENLIDHIKGHESSLRLLIRNLLTNAISYTPACGEVNIKLCRQNQHIILTIEDNGPGISGKDIKRVTERFYRAENHSAPGCGIGLSIVDRVVQMHQGTLQFCQADSGRGLKVIIQFK